MDFVVLSDIAEVAILEASSPVTFKNETGFNSCTGSLSFGLFGAILPRFFFERGFKGAEAVFDLPFFDSTFLFRFPAGSSSGGCMLMGGTPFGWIVFKGSAFTLPALAAPVLLALVSLTLFDC